MYVLVMFYCLCGVCLISAVHVLNFVIIYVKNSDDDFVV